MTNSPENLSAHSTAESAMADVLTDVSAENLFSAFNLLASAAAGKPQLCGLCVQDWAVAPSLMCSTCICVDDALAALAGSQHFLPHIWPDSLTGQPEHVMTCTLHKLHHPKDTGFYGVYTTMYRMLAHTSRVKRGQARKRVTAGATSASDIATSLQPSRVHSLEQIVIVTSELFAVARPWLDGVIDQVRLLCEKQDAESPITLTDYQRARIAMVLR